MKWLLNWLSDRRRNYNIEVRLAFPPGEIEYRWESLSPRQREIVILICQGYTNPQIAAELYISPETVKTHIRRILYKFSLNSKAELRFLLSIQ